MYYEDLFLEGYNDAIDFINEGEFWDKHKGKILGGAAILAGGGAAAIKHRSNTKKINKGMDALKKKNIMTVSTDGKKLKHNNGNILADGENKYVIHGNKLFNTKNNRYVSRSATLKLMKQHPKTFSEGYYDALNEIEEYDDYNDYEDAYLEGYYTALMETS